VTDDFVLRTTYAEGFRAPSIGELYGSAARADLQLFDPCSVGLGGTPPRVAAPPTVPRWACRPASSRPTRRSR
jgi:iron complex outermembrane receptor protein